MMKVLMIRIEPFPYGNASSSRALNLARLFAFAGNEVTVIAPVISTDRVYNHKLMDEENISVYSSNGERDIANAVNTILKNGDFDLIIRSANIRLYDEIEKAIISANKGIPTILDSVEWYNASNWRFEHFDPRYYKFLLYWRFVFPKKEGIIAISRMIESYYNRFSSNVVRIPTITDCSNTGYRTEDECSNTHRIRLIFAGSLDRGKDSIKNMLLAWSELGEQKSIFAFDIFGPTKKEVEKHLGSYKRILKNDNIVIHGKTDQQVVQKACMESDFSFFFRKQRRSSNAGFPTKLGECMSVGTPVICNNTGDIGLVVKNRINGFLVETDSVEDIKESLFFILNMSCKERDTMRKQARISAGLFFDYRNYKTQINQVINRIKEQCNSKEEI